MNLGHPFRRRLLAVVTLAGATSVCLVTPITAQASSVRHDADLTSSQSSLSLHSSLSLPSVLPEFTQLSSSSSLGSSESDTANYFDSQVRPTAEPATIRFGDEVVNEPGEHENWAAQNIDHVEYAEAYSPAMGIDVPLLIARPQDLAQRENAPTIYLLNGLEGGTGWFLNTDAVEFYTSRGVNVVMPTTGGFTYYTNWIEGPNQWDTFLARELPGALEKRLGANGKRAVMGVSMSATSAVSLAQHNPGTYDGIGVVSGCISTTSPVGKYGVNQVLGSGPTPATFEDAWGDSSGDYARHWDPMLNLDKLSPEYQGKDLQIFISSPSGLAGYESLTTTSKLAEGDVDTAMNFVVIGGAIDSVTNLCSHVTTQRLRAHGIEHDAKFYPQGTHNWNSFTWAVEDSWPTLSKGLGVQE